MKAVILVALFFHSAVGVSTEGDYVRRGLEVVGKPDSLELYDVDKGQVLRESAAYDEQGRIRRRTSFDHTGSFQTRTAYRHNDDGSLSAVTAYDEYDKQLWRHDYRYDGTELQQEIYYNSGGNVEYTELYRYDGNGELIERARYSATGLPQWRTVYEHEPDEHRTVRTVYYGDGRIIRQGVEEYDSEGRKVREIRRDEVEETYEEVHFSYDYRGRLAVERISDAGGVLHSVRRLRYDEHDNVVEDVVETFDGTITRRTSYDYRYDRNDNWIARVWHEREKPEFGPLIETFRTHYRRIDYGD